MYCEFYLVHFYHWSKHTKFFSPLIKSASPPHLGAGQVRRGHDLHRERLGHHHWGRQLGSRPPEGEHDHHVVHVDRVGEHDADKFKCHNDWNDLDSQVDVPVVSDEHCRDSYGQSDITDSMICAGNLAMKYFPPTKQTNVYLKLEANFRIKDIR